MRSDIQALRGTAVIGIVLFHFNETIFHLGYLGVDSFFVISGYLIYPRIEAILDGSTLKIRTNDLRDFYLRRIWRLLPAFLAFYVVSLVLLFLFAPLDDHKRIWYGALFSIVGIGNIGAYKFSGDYFHPNPNPFIHTWSLSVEEQIYLGLPLFLLGILRVAKKAQPNLVLLSLTITSAYLFFNRNQTNYLFSKIGIQYASLLNLPFYLPTHRIWEFGLGALASVLTASKVRIILPKEKITFTTLLVLNLILWTFKIQESIALLLVITITLTLLISKTQQKRKVYSENILVFIGNRSYSIYLAHMPIIYVLRYSPTISNQLSWPLLFLVYILVTLLFSLLILYPIEKKYRFSTGSNE